MTASSAFCLHYKTMEVTNDLIRYFDMFAGIGGFRAGLTRVGGFQCVGHCEIDKYADTSYRAIHDIREEERYYPDARKIDPSDLPDFDLLCGGFPCQAFSYAGQRRGLPTPEALSSLRLPGWLKQNGPGICCLKMCPEFWAMTKDAHLRPSSPHWMTWGIMSNGLCLTQNYVQLNIMEILQLYAEGGDAVKFKLEEVIGAL